MGFYQSLQMISPKPILPELAPWAASWAFQMASPGHLREQNHPASGRRRRSRLPRLYNTGRVGKRAAHQSMGFTASSGEIAKTSPIPPL